MILLIKLKLTLNNCFSHRNVFQNGVDTLSKMVNHFWSNSSKFSIVRTYDFVQISPARGPNTYQIMYGETLDIGNDKIKCSLGKSIFTANLPFKLFRVTVANADNGSLKSLHTFLLKCV